MKRGMMMRLTATHVTLGLGVCLALAAVGTSPAAAPKSAKAPSSGALVAKGKSLAASDRCNTCHGADYAGKKGFSPSLHAAGVLHEYTPKTWARVMDTGVTNDGGKVHPPMPVYHLKAADSGALYAYFKTLK
jgi:mono/diheme cytochrome c family protein